MSLDEPEPIDSALTFPSGYDTLEYSWVKVTSVSVHLRILFVMLQSTNRQGDPLPPLLFVLAADLLQSLLNKARQQGVAHPCSAYSWLSNSAIC